MSTHMSKPMKIGIIGYGNAARVYHLPYITSNPNYVIHAFYQRAALPENGKPHVSIDYPDVKHYSDLDEFLKDSEIELVCVLTQYDTHAAFAEKALLAGKHGKSGDPLVYLG
jgi:predicted dehydrogenase